MKWVLLTAGVLALLVVVACAVGAMLPPRHQLTRTVRLAASPDAVYALYAGPPDWRGVKKYGDLPDTGGKKRWWEDDGHGGKITYELVEAVPARRRVTRIADEKLPYGGTWTFEVTPDGTGSTVRISEDGIVHNVFFRFMARFIFGYEGSISNVLKSLTAKFGGVA
jgi:hypothetical protein